MTSPDEEGFDCVVVELGPPLPIQPFVFFKRPCRGEWFSVPNWAMSPSPQRGKYAWLAAGHLNPGNEKAVWDTGHLVFL